MLFPTRRAAAAAIAAFAVSPAFANSGNHLTQWNDRAAFEALLEAPVTTLDFAGVPTTNFTSAEILAGVDIGGGVTMTGATTLPDPPDDGDLRIRGEELDLILINIPIDASIETITFDFDSPIQAFGADWDFPFSRSAVLFNALGTAISFSDALDSNAGFLGVTSDVPFDSFTLSLAFADADPPLKIDNLTFAANAVPEPGSLACLALLGSTALIRRRATV